MDVQRQQQLYWRSLRRISDGNRHFMEMVTHPTNPLTNADLVKLVRRHPQRWGRFSGFIGKLSQ